MHRSSFRRQRGFVSIVVASLAFGLSGCATYTRIADYPTPDKPSAVAIVDKPMSKMSELPLGAHYDPERQVIVTGHQKGLLAGMMFGVVGVVVADQMNKSSGGEKYGAAAAQADDLVSLLDGAVDAALAGGQAPHWAEAAGAAGLRLTPYAVFTVEKSGDSRLYAMLRAEIPGPNGKPTWSGRYFARAPGLHVLSESGWMNPDHFTPAMDVALRQALMACIEDTHGRLTGRETVTAKGYYPYLNQEFEIRAIVVKEAPEYLVAKLAVGDAAVLAGTHVLMRSDYQVKPAKFADPRR
jgi:hypothetical protein